MALALMAGPALADVYLSGEQVSKQIVGNTIEGTYRECAVGRKDFREYFKADGKIHGQERLCNQAGSWSRYTGTWKVKDGKFCVTVPDRPSGCFNYKADKDGSLTRDEEKGVTGTKFKIYDGNPDHL